LGKFALTLHPEKTRLIEFGRFAAERRERRGLGKPETFNFLGFHRTPRVHHAARRRGGMVAGCSTHATTGTDAETLINLPCTASLVKERFGTDHAYYAVALNKLGIVVQTQGKYTDWEQKRRHGALEKAE
jgi:hypothetical protein